MVAIDAAQQTAAKTVPCSTWILDPVSSVAEFKVTYLMTTYVKGMFSGLSGVLKRDGSDDIYSYVEFSIPAPSLKTVDERFDPHLKDEEFFDAEKFPTITFKSTSFRSTADRNYAMTGDLTIHGLTKSVTIATEDVTDTSSDPWSYQRIGLFCSITISRKDFGLVWQDSGGVLVGDEVTISLKAQFAKK